MKMGALALLISDMKLHDLYLFLGGTAMFAINLGFFLGLVKVRALLLLVLGGASIWHGCTTVAGTYDILGSGWGQFAGSVVFALVIIGFLLGTSEVLDLCQGWPLFVVCLVSLVWVCAFGYNLFTSYVGNCRLIVGDSLEASSKILVLSLTAFISCSPVCLSFLWQETRPIPHGLVGQRQGHGLLGSLFSAEARLFSSVIGFMFAVAIEVAAIVLGSRLLEGGH